MEAGDSFRLERAKMQLIRVNFAVCFATHEAEKGEAIHATPFSRRTFLKKKRYIAKMGRRTPALANPVQQKHD